MLGVVGFYIVVSMVELELGDLAARYRLEELLGEGGMGRVFRAYDTTLHRRVAIKVLRGDRFPSGSEALERVLREARLAAALEHPGAVAVYDVNEDPGQPFIVMELVSGRSLRELVGVFEVPLSERLRWLVEVAKTLGAAHRVGLVHRDLKPENVMLGDDGRVKLLDFGISSRVGLTPGVGGGASASAAESPLAGTPRYMAPEQLQRRPIDARVDQFAWGVLAYELLSGALPWRSLNDGVTTAVAVVTERQEPLSDRLLGVPSALASIIDRALEKLPARRFESMDALVVALEAELPALVGASVQPTGRRRRSPRPLSSPTLEQTKPGAPRGPPEVETKRRPKARRWGLAVALSLAGLVLAVASVVVLAVTEETATRPSLPELEWQPELEPNLEWKPGSAAQAAYDEGMRRFEGAAATAGREQLNLAVEYEPEFAAAHLRLAYIQMVDGPYEGAAVSFHAASGQRQRLGASDRRLLDALAPAFTNDPPALAEVVTGLGALVEREPERRELALLHAIVLGVDAQYERAEAGYRALLETPEPPASAWLALAYGHGGQAQLDEAYDAVSRCLEQTADAIDCYWYRLKLDAYMGRCAQMETDARMWTALGTADYGAPLILISALVAQDAPESEIAWAREQARARMTVTQQILDFALLDAARSILEGELDAAEQILAKLPSEVELDEWYFIRVAELRVALLEELGDLAGASTLAAGYLQRRASLDGEGYDGEEQALRDPSMYFNAVRFAAGELGADELEATRRSWIEAQGVRGESGVEELRWLRAHAEPARTPAHAHAALAVLAQLEGPRSFVEDRLFNVEVARVHLLAGQPEPAVTLLRQACASCLAVAEPLRFVQAHLLLGEALELTGEVQGACVAYEHVLRHWGAAPRSTSASRARQRRLALGCAAG